MRGGSGFLVGATLVVLSGQVGAQRVSPPTIHASAIVIEAQTGKVLFAHNAETPLPPASTTKIATGLLLTQLVSSEHPIRTSQNAAQTTGHSLGMRPGETFSARDLLYAILLPSANDASEAAAEDIAGGDAAFAAKMNALARQAGAKATHFVNPHGLPASGHISTAHDLALLARAAMRDPRFAAAVRTRTYDVLRDGGRPPTAVMNQNDLLGRVPGMDGVKTGYTREAGYCFVGSATRQGRRVITVVLHSSDWRADTIALLDYGFAVLGKAKATSQHAKESTPKANTKLSGKPSALKANVEATQSGIKHSEVRQDSTTVGHSDRIATKPEETLPDATKPSGAQPGQATSGDTKPGETRDEAATANETKFADTTPDDAAAIASPPRQSEPDRTPSEAVQPFALAVPPVAAHPKKQPAKRQPGAKPLLSPSAPTQPGVMAATGEVPTLPAAEKPALPEKNVLPGAPRYSIGTRHYGWLEIGALALIWQLLRWWWLLVLLAALVWLAYKRGFAMRLPIVPPGGWKWKRKVHAQRIAQTYKMVGNASLRPESVTKAVKPPFTFQAPVLTRHEGRPWLHSILDNAPRLLEPFVRRQARALLEADPLACDERVRALLASNNPKLRVVGAELLAPHAPLRAEETLLTILEDEQTPPALRAEAVRLLSEIGGDRHERLWTQLLLRDGTPAVASALARLARLTDPTRQALSHVLHAPRPVPSDNDTALRLQLRDAYIASALAAHDELSDTAWADVLNKLPENHRYEVVVNALAGVATDHATEKLVEVALRGPAYTGMLALMEQEPESVRSALTKNAEKLDHAARTRALILRWLLLGEGDRSAIQNLADAGNDLARGALQLAQQQRWDTIQASPDALLAAAQIISLRLGYTLHSPEQIAQAFRKVADAEEKGTVLAQAPELQTLAQAYGHSEVYDAVQTGLHTEDGMHSLLAPLAMQPNNPAYRAELAFWSDKVPRPTRLLLTQALATPQEEANEDISAQEALVARAGDHCPLIRATARRALHARPQTYDAPVDMMREGKEEVFAPVGEMTMPPAPDSDETLNQAA